MDLVYRVLDEQLVDVDGRRCGRVDDLEFDETTDAAPRLHSILSGSGTWHRRLARPLRPLGERIFGAGVSGRDVIRVPWSEVDEISSVIHLKGKARDLGLGQGDESDAIPIAKLPNS